MHTVSLTHQLVAIQDDFDLDKIIESGQCFRPQKLSDGRYRFLSGSALLYLTPEDYFAGRKEKTLNFNSLQMLMILSKLKITISCSELKGMFYLKYLNKNFIVAIELKFDIN